MDRIDSPVSEYVGICMGDLPDTTYRKKCCRNCHFLSKTSRGHQGNTILESMTEWDRESFVRYKEHRSLDALSGMVRFDTILCYKKIWPQIERTLNLQHLRFIAEKIEEVHPVCFYLYQIGVELEAADELQKHEIETRRVRLKVALQIAGLIVGVCGIITKVIGLW